MPELSNAIQTMLNGRMLRVGHLVEFQLDDPLRFWDGFRMLDTLDGREWSALKYLVSIDGLEEENDNLQASEITMSLSGVNSDLLQLAVAEDRASYIGRLIMTNLQFLTEDWQCQDDPIARNASIIDGIELTWKTNPDGSQTRTLSVKATNIFYGRSVPPAGNYSNRDQDFRSPGDRGLEFVAAAVEERIKVPW